MNDREISNLVSAITQKIKEELCLTDISLKCANKIIDAVINEAERIGIKVVVAVSDSSGVPVSIQKMDDAYIASYDIALNKSYTTVALKMPTSELKKLAAPGGSLYGIQFTNNGKIVVLGGGNPLKLNGKICGGLGVSGGTEEQDTYLSLFGIKYFEENFCVR